MMNLAQNLLVLRPLKEIDNLRTIFIYCIKGTEIELLVFKLCPVLFG